jgi:membrane fusion protein, multidrug efflux system
LNSRVDPVSQTVEIEAKMAKSYPELLSGMSGVADFTAFY